MAKILIVEDDESLANAVRINLVARDHDAKITPTASQALQVIGEWMPDLVLLDLGLPDMSGLRVVQGTRGWSDVPIIVVSARHEQLSIIEALDQGADDYVTKPFAMGELLARIRVALRRQPEPGAGQQPVVETLDGKLRFDLSTKQVWRDGTEVKLTPNEWGIVDYLIRNRDSLVSKLDLLHAVWGENYNRETNYLRVYLSQLRQKLEEDSKNPKHFITLPGVGYRFEL